VKVYHRGLRLKNGLLVALRGRMVFMGSESGIEMFERVQAKGKQRLKIIVF